MYPICAIHILLDATSYLTSLLNTYLQNHRSMGQRDELHSHNHRPLRDSVELARHRLLSNMPIVLVTWIDIPILSGSMRQVKRRCSPTLSSLRSCFPSFWRKARQINGNRWKPSNAGWSSVSNAGC